MGEMFENGELNTPLTPPKWATNTQMGLTSWPPKTRTLFCSLVEEESCNFSSFRPPGPVGRQAVILFLSPVKDAVNLWCLMCLGSSSVTILLPSWVWSRKTLCLEPGRKQHMCVVAHSWIAKGHAQQPRGGLADSEIPPDHSYTNIQ